MAAPWLRTVRLGVSSLLLHKLRSLLTTVGVLLGTGSVIAMLAVGEGAGFEAQEQLRMLGSQNVILRSVKPPEDPSAGNQTSSVLIYGLTHQDLERVAETFPAVDTIVPVREILEEVRFRDRVLSPRVLATLPDYIDVTGRLVHAGRFLNARDEESVANVCVLGTEVARYLFPLQSPLGQVLRVGGDYYRVVGTLAPRVSVGDSAAAGADMTEEVFIPLATGQKWYGEMQVRQRAGSREMEQVQLHEIIVEVDHADNVSMVADACREMLERGHKKRDWEVVVPLELIARQKETSRIFSIVLGTIASISLLVGGVGITNVMLATVTERTREIGIRRALGAKQRHIIAQFLVEAIVLTIGGALLGVLFGFFIPPLIGHFSDMRTIVTAGAVALAFGISTASGLVFGIYPAWRAAKMDPVEALRHE